MMTNKDLFDLLSFEVENGLKTVGIIQDVELGDGAHFLRAELTYDYGEDSIDTIVVPFIKYDGEDWLFTPWDWQASDFVTSPAEITDIDWRVNDTARHGIMYNGLPRLF